MAEIKVERRKNNPIWPWIAGMILLLLIVWGLVEFFQRDEPEIVTATEVTEGIERDPVADRVAGEAPEFEAERRVNEFTTYVEETDSDQEDAPELGLEHEYTRQGIERLSAALAALAREADQEEADVAQARERMEERARRLQQDPASLQHANIIQQSFMEATELMEGIQQRRFPDQASEVQDVRSAAEEIDADTPALEQEEAIKEFFSHASDALQAMIESDERRREVDQRQEQEADDQQRGQRGLDDQR